jgi:phospholipase/lecithinase/hemolysin
MGRHAICGALLMIKNMIFGCLSMMLAAPAFAAGEAPFEQIVVFGTSLSDPGNAFALGADNNVPPDYFVDTLLVPSAPYARGGHHFCNGETWIEQLGRSVGLTRDVSPAFRGSSDTATNFAVGGARARDVGNFSLSLQGKVSDLERSQCRSNARHPYARHRVPGRRVLRDAINPGLQ